jgi:soluble cytochrome b562
LTICGIRDRLRNLRNGIEMDDDEWNKLSEPDQKYAKGYMHGLDISIAMIDSMLKNEILRDKYGVMRCGQKRFCKNTR